MNNITSVIRLDFLTVKQYLTWKNLLIFIIVGGVLTASSGTGSVGMGILIVLGTIYGSYPFIIGEKHGIDALFISLAIKRNEVVLGRYCYAWICNLTAACFALVLAFVISLVMRTGFNLTENLLVIAFMFVGFTIIQAFQLPVFFKLRYSQEKLLNYLPLVVFPVLMGILVGMSFYDSEPSRAIVNFFSWFSKNLILSVVMIVILWIVIMFVSYRLSLKFYSWREF